MKLRVLGLDSWWHPDAEPVGQLRYGTRAEWCNGGWLVVAVKRWSR